MTTASRIRLRLVGDERLLASVRHGDPAAFEALYDRHSAELLSFCVYMLGSRHDAEDAVQATFASAYRALRADRRAVALRPWLFAIARNECLSILRRRRPWVELDGEPALNGDPLLQLEQREEVRQTIEGLRALPESQRASLILAELHGFSQAEIGLVLGVQAEQVKAFICQARANLISERSAREADCGEIREELATARGAALLRGRLRRHLRSCDDCRTYADGVSRQRRHLGLLLPLGPSLMLKYRALEDAFGTPFVADPAGFGGTAIGGSVAGTAAGVAGGGLKALILKIAAGVLVVGAGAGAGSSVLLSPASTAGASPTSAVAALAPGASGHAAPPTGSTARPAPGSPTRGTRVHLPASARETGLGPPQQVAPVQGGRQGLRVPSPSTRPASTEDQRSAEREHRAEEARRHAEELRAQAREQRSPAPAAVRLAEQRRTSAERAAARQRRTPKSDQEREKVQEERRSGRASRPRPTKPSKEDRQRLREERRSERVPPPPKSEAEKEKDREENLRRREAKKAASGG